MNRKPSKCCYPNCFNCPYDDCEYDRLETEDYTETNNRDYELYEAETGRKLHKTTDKEYQNKRHTAYQRGNRKYVDRHQYNQDYYKKHSEKIRDNFKKNYDTKTNTERCRAYRDKNPTLKKTYDSEYYIKHAEEKKRKAKERYYRKKEELQYGL